MKNKTPRESSINVASLEHSVFVQLFFSQIIEIQLVVLLAQVGNT
jgi:hypothetical protein